VEQWAPRGEVELIGEFAAPFVGLVLMQIVMGDMEPEQRARASEAVLGCTHHPSPETFAQLARCSAERLATAQRNPEQAQGVLKAIITGTTAGRPLTDEERLGVLNILFLGGLDTTRAAISMIALRVAQDPALENRLRAPEWIKQDLDEFLRIDSPVATFARVATRDVELGGVTIHKGQRVLVRYDSANRDDHRFPDADQLVFDPALRPSNAAFGIGIHRCLGAQLARIQIPIAWEEIFKRATRFQMAADPSSLIWEPGIANGPTTVPLRFDYLEESDR
jgi:cytochrome P450